MLYAAFEPAAEILQLTFAKSYRESLYSHAQRRIQGF